MICSTKKCHNSTRPSPGALYCQACQDTHMRRIESSWYKQPRLLSNSENHAQHAADLTRLAADKHKPRYKKGKPLKGSPAMLFVSPEGPLSSSSIIGVFDGPPNVTCPACAGRYHYGAPVPFTHACPLCAVWLCWKETGGTKDKVLRVARKCPACGVVLQERNGPYGPWWGCTFVRKNHKDNCSGRRKYHDCDMVTVQVPSLGLAVWRGPHTWDDSDPVDHFARLDLGTQERKTAIEERNERYKVRWWERGPGLGLDTGEEF